MAVQLPTGDTGTEAAAIVPYAVSSAVSLTLLGRETRIDGNLALPLPSVWLSTFPLCLLPMSCLRRNLGTGGEGGWCHLPSARCAPGQRMPKFPARKSS